LTGPKILLFDIETAPIEGYTWQMYDANVIAVKRPTYMLAWAAKWRGGKKVIARTLPDYPSYQKSPTDDSALVKELHGLLDEADVVIAHNADFDVKKTNARFLANRIFPPSPYKTFCTLKTARKHFKFDSNKLDSLGGYLGVGRKVKHTGINLWLECMDGNLRSWEIMKKYNTQDVVLLERVFEKLRGYATNFPDSNMWTGASCCPVCQSSRMQHRGYNVSRAGRKQRFQCQDCGNWSSFGRAVKEAA
jgi:hypothetical protein